MGGFGALQWERSGEAVTWIVPWAVNAAGETALDVARRLKHIECEELVGGTEAWEEMLRLGEGTKVPGEGWHRCGGFPEPVPPVLRPP